MPKRAEGNVLNERMQDALNNHINQEFYASYLHLSMSAYCESINLPGFAHCLRVQSREEDNHALKLVDFVNDRQGRVMLYPIAQPPVEFLSPLQVMECALDQEKEVTVLIHQLYELAVQENDYATQQHLQWFISEQVAEEKAASLIVEQLKTIGNRGDALLWYDQQLAARGVNEQATPN